MSAIEDCWNSCELCDVHTYFAMLKEEFSQPADTKRSKRSLSKQDLCKDRSCYQSKGNSSQDKSPRSFRHSMTEADDFLQSKQKSLELNQSRLNRKHRSVSTSGLSFEGKHVSSRWYTKNDDNNSNNNIAEADLSELQSNHRERALNQGKLYSVAEQNRKQRKKYYGKMERKLSREGPSFMQQTSSPI